MFGPKNRGGVVFVALILSLLVALTGCFNPVGPDGGGGGGDGGGGGGTTPPAPSTDATLSALVITPNPGGAEFTFASGTLTYDGINVANSVVSVTVAPTANHGGASIKVNGTGVSSGSASGAIPLDPEVSTDVTIVVTAEDGTTTKTYSLTLIRAAGDPTDGSLATLFVGAEEIASLSGTDTYPVTVDNAVSEVAIVPTANDAGATIEVDGTEVASGTASDPIALNVGLGGGINVVDVVVTSADGTSETLTYTLDITREPRLGTVTFSAEGGTGTMPVQEIYEGETENLDANGFSRLGHTFNGWATTQSDAAAGDIDYADGASLTMGATDVVLYASWSPNDYDVVFDKNSADATGAMSNQTITFGETVTLNANGFSHESGAFLGWAESAGGAVAYVDAASYTMTSEGATLYAKWDIPHVLQPTTISGTIAGAISMLDGTLDDTFDASGSDAIAFDGSDPPLELDRYTMSSNFFELTITPIEDSLVPITNEMPPTVTVSDESASTQTAFLELDDGADGAALLYGTYSVSIVGLDVTIEQVFQTYLYVDKPVTVTGSETDTEVYDGVTYTEYYTYDLDLDEGWNLVRVDLTTDETDTTVDATYAFSSDSMPGGSQWFVIPDGLTAGGAGIAAYFTAIPGDYWGNYVDGVIVAQDADPLVPANWLAFSDPAQIESGAGGPIFFFDTLSSEPFYGEDGVTYDIYARITDDPYAGDPTLELYVTASDGGPLAQVVASSIEPPFASISLEDAVFFAP